ncbi:Hypothetical protein SMAX5B_014348 [Scophthalmus maximus]|uniref:Uncharacterized protein n=1 Tax=Scophthalmus maximus TaxID=52904 RepID=A0A2U9BHH3_SCOMX|nr:Hypothetical protein SMAX5B_014348 [Scophthalmus maximus]
MTLIVERGTSLLPQSVEITPAAVRSACGQRSRLSVPRTCVLLSVAPGGAAAAAAAAEERVLDCATWTGGALPIDTRTVLRTWIAESTAPTQESKDRTIAPLPRTALRCLALRAARNIDLAEEPCVLFESPGCCVWE